MKIVDEFTGRIMEGRRWSEGLHQAVEAKEGVKIQEEHVTLATITLQNYFRLYEKLAGMTGTAKTEEKEFVEIYDLHVAEIPTNQDVVRADRNDLIYKTQDAKFAGGRSTTSRSATRRGSRSSSARSRSRPPSICRAARPQRHPAQRPEREGARARGGDHQGRRPAEGAVTIATNMAGRGVDIKLGAGRARARRAVCPRHRAPRGAPDRQPAARPFGPPGRPRRVALLSVRPGRPRAPVRGRPHLQDHGPLQDSRGRADGGRNPLPADRERAEEGRGAELRHAQERPQVRRRPQQAAHGHLRAAPPGAGRRGSLRGGAGVDQRGRGAGRRPVHSRGGREDMDLDALVQAMPTCTRPRSRSTSCGRRSASTARR